MVYRVVNVPTAKSGLELVGLADREEVKIICRDPNRPEDFSRVADMWIGDHLFTKPGMLRQHVADALARAVLYGRDAGYAQAKAEIREVLGVKP